MNDSRRWIDYHRRLARNSMVWAAVALTALMVLGSGSAAPIPSHAALSSAGSSMPSPTWWAKAQLLHGLSSERLGPVNAADPLTIGPNIDVSNEPGPQSETSIAINPLNPSEIVGGSNEIARDPMRAYFSSNAGATWGGVDLPLPPALTPTGVDFGSDPGVAWDLKGNAYYSYIVVFFNAGFANVTGSEMAVAHSVDDGHTWISTFFALQHRPSPFDDKPMIAVDTNRGSPHLNTIYVAWDLTGTDQSDDNAILVSASTDGGHTFSTPVAASATDGPEAKQVIGADPFVSASGTLYVAWNNFRGKLIQVSSSSNGGHTFGPTHTIASTKVYFDIPIPAQSSRHALIYPACGASPSTDKTAGSGGLLYCSWTDGTLSRGIETWFARSADGGLTWSAPIRVNDDPVNQVNDHFNQWLAVDPKDGSIHISWYDTRLDPSRLTTNVFYARSTDHGLTFSANVRVTTAPTNENTAGADLGNQYGDYEGIAAFGGIAYPIWTDRRASVAALGEEVFTAAIRAA